MAKPRGRGRTKKGRKPGAPVQRKRRPRLSAEELDWKNFPSLRRFLSERGKIRSRRITGLSRRQQTILANAVKRAREMGLLIYPDQDRRVKVQPVGPPAGPVSAQAAVAEAEAQAHAPGDLGAMGDTELVAEELVAPEPVGAET
jgi:small subunit ribosomal protein S18